MYEGIFADVEEVKRILVLRGHSAVDETLVFELLEDLKSTNLVINVLLGSSRRLPSTNANSSTDSNSEISQLHTTFDIDDERASIQVRDHSLNVSRLDDPCEIVNNIPILTLRNNSVDDEIQPIPTPGYSSEGNTLVSLPEIIEVARIKEHGARSIQVDPAKPVIEIEDNHDHVIDLTEISHGTNSMLDASGQDSNDDADPPRDLKSEEMDANNFPSDSDAEMEDYYQEIYLDSEESDEKVSPPPLLILSALRASSSPPPQNQMDDLSNLELTLSRVNEMLEENNNDPNNNLEDIQMYGNSSAMNENMNDEREPDPAPIKSEPITKSEEHSYGSPKPGCSKDSYYAEVDIAAPGQSGKGSPDIKPTTTIIKEERKYPTEFGTASCRSTCVNDLLTDAKDIKKVLADIPMVAIMTALNTNKHAINRVQLTLWDLLPDERPPTCLFGKRVSTGDDYTECAKKKRTAALLVTLDDPVETVETVNSENARTTFHNTQSSVDRETKMKKCTTTKALETENSESLEGPSESLSPTLSDWSKKNVNIPSQIVSVENDECALVSRLKVKKEDVGATESVSLAIPTNESERTTDSEISNIEKFRDPNDVIKVEPHGPEYKTNIDELREHARRCLMNWDRLSSEPIDFPTNTCKLAPSKLNHVVGRASHNASVEVGSRNGAQSTIQLKSSQLGILSNPQTLPTLDNPEDRTKHFSDSYNNWRSLKHQAWGDLYGNQRIDQQNPGPAGLEKLALHGNLTHSTPINTRTNNKINLKPSSLQLSEKHEQLSTSNTITKVTKDNGSKNPVAPPIFDPSRINRRNSTSSADLRNHYANTESEDSLDSWLVSTVHELESKMNQIESDGLKAHRQPTPHTHRKHKLVTKSRETLHQSVPSTSEAGVSNIGTKPKQKIVPPPTLFNPLINMFPNVDPNYIGELCIYAKLKNQSLEILVERLLETGTSHPRVVNPDPEPTVFSADEQYENLQSIFPDAHPEYLRDFAERYYDDPEAMKNFVQQRLENKDYPTMAAYLEKVKVTQQIRCYTIDFDVKNFLDIFPTPFEHFEDPNRNCKYNVLAFEFLKNRFKSIKVMTIQKIYSYGLHKYNLSLSAQKLETIGSDMKTKRTDKPFPTEDIPLLQEMAFITHRQKIKEYLMEQKLKEEKEFRDLKERDLLLECQCCFDSECMPSKCFSCTEGHRFCHSCVLRGAQTRIGDGLTEFPCFGDCQGEFSLLILQKALPPTQFSILLRKRQEAEVMAAGLEGLVSCPFCHFASIPPPEDKVFKCLNPECMKESCRKCKELNHVPLRCDEVTKGEEARRYLEEKMTAALVRLCYRCSRPFFKEEGCNKMTCPCGASMCYICEKPVTDYRHFNGQGADQMNLCPLWSDNRLINAQTVRAVAEAAEKELLSNNPNIRIDAAALMPALPAATKGPHEYVPNAHILPIHAQNRGQANPVPR